MKALRCDINTKFGYWTVINDNYTVKSGHTYVQVICKCGKIEEKCLSDLFNKRATGCRSCKARERSQPIIIGDVYKNWKVTGTSIKSSRGCILWPCQCPCGNKRFIQGNELINPKKCFVCRKCAAIKRGALIAKHNGKIGELTLTRYTRLKTSAIKRKIEFNVSIDFLWKLFKKQNQICAITGDYIININKASLDRIDSSLNYTEDNVQWVTYQANVSKHTMSMQTLYTFCEKVLNYANQQPSIPLKKYEGSETNS